MLKGFKLDRILNESGVSKMVVLLGRCGHISVDTR